MEGLDLEITTDRETRIKEILLRLFADQMGLDYNTMEVTVEKVNKEPA